jgi:hypothetical protein
MIFPAISILPDQPAATNASIPLYRETAATGKNSQYALAA